RVPAQLADPVRKRLALFIMRSKVGLEENSDQPVHVGVSGSDVAERLRKHAGKMPEQSDQACEANGLTIIRVPGPHPRFEIVGEAKTMIELWDFMAPICQPVGEHG